MSAPRLYARWAGALALVLVVLGPFSMMYLPTTLYVAGDAAATAQKIAASEGLFRLGILSDLTICLTEVVLLTLLYALFKPVNPVVSLMAATSRLAMTVVQGVNIFGSLAVLALVGGTATSGALGADVSAELLMRVLNTHEQGVHVWEAFFALHCLLLGYLVFQSGFVPKFLGPLMVMAALGYLANSVGNLLYPQSKATLTSIVAVTAILGELPLFLWFLFKAVDADKWAAWAARRSPTAQ